MATLRATNPVATRIDPIPVSVAAVVCVPALASECYAARRTDRAAHIVCHLMTHNLSMQGRYV